MPRRLFIFFLVAAFPAAPQSYELRATGKTRAVKETGVLVPAIAGQSGRMTLAAIVASGSMAKEGDILAEFDPSRMVDSTREIRARLEDFSNQYTQKVAENRASVEKRNQEMTEGRAEQAKAELQIRKGSVLPEIDRMQAEIKADDARQRVASLEKSQKLRVQVDAMALKTLEVKRDRQQTALDRAISNLERMSVKAPISGMVAVEGVNRGSGMQPYQTGDMMNSGQSLLRIFDPSQMNVIAAVGEPDGAVLKEGAVVDVRLDAYPDLALKGRLVSWSPVAAAVSYGSPIKQFIAVFRVEKTDPRILPDMAAAVVFRSQGGK